MKLKGNWNKKTTNESSKRKKKISHIKSDVSRKNVSKHQNDEKETLGWDENPFFSTF